jgi:hypothetical protein
MAKKPSQIYQIKVTLDHTHPPIWRRILVPGSTTLLKLHDILQIVMGWEDYHLHMFTIEGLIYGDPVDDEYGDLGTINEANYRLRQVIHREGQRFSYEYDFGDSWEHTLLVEKILSPQAGVRYPHCLKGRRACPPEDVGGVRGYENFLEALRDPRHDEHGDYLTWVGGEFDPQAFDLEAVNARLHRMGRGRSTESLSPWSMNEDELTGKRFDLASPWSRTLADDQRSVAAELPLRRDVVALLTYLRANKITGTQSTGNLPLKAVHEVCALFVDPPRLERAIGKHAYRVRSEIEVWPLFFRHVLASVAGLVSGGMGRRWKLTPLGERFLAAPAPMQVWLLCATWWMQTNWAIASPYDFEDGYVSPRFSRLALSHLLDLPVGERASFEPFADRIIEDARMVWPIQDQVSARRILHAIIERMVIGPLEDFGILQAEYEPHKTLGAEFRELAAFRITPFGRGLLEAINNVITQERP